VFRTEILPQGFNSKGKVIGINTRNLRTLEMNPDNVFNISRLVPSDRVIVAESGIKSPSEIDKLQAARVSAILVGESLLKANDPVKAVQDMVNAGVLGGRSR